MIDLHGHYLPGVDDGAADWERSLAMLRHAENDGISAVVATPHVFSRMGTVREIDALRGCWAKWEAALAGSGVSLRVLRGAEVFFTTDLISLLKDNRDLLTINNGSYFLLEYPPDYIYAHSREFIYQVLTEGFIPIISHAERNAEVQRSPAVLRELVKAGALCQLNAGSLRGDFGHAARECAHELVHANLVHVIASDAHDMEGRRPELSYVPALLPQVGMEKIDLYLDGIPAAIIADEGIPDIGEPVQPRAARSIFDLFRKHRS